MDSSFCDSGLWSNHENIPGIESGKGWVWDRFQGGLCRGGNGRVAGRDLNALPLTNFN